MRKRRSWPEEERQAGVAGPRVRRALAARMPAGSVGARGGKWRPHGEDKPHLGQGVVNKSPFRLRGLLRPRLIHSNGTQRCCCQRSIHWLIGLPDS